MRKTCAAALVAVMTFSSGGARAHQTQGAALPPAAGRERLPDAQLLPIQYRHHDHRRDRHRHDRDAFRDRSYWDRRHGHGYYDRHFGGYRRDDGAAIAAGFLGMILGAAIAGSARDRDYARARMNDQSWIASCSRRYKSFDSASGTYLGYDGYRHYCR